MKRLVKTSSLSALALAVVLGAAPQVSFAATEIGSVAAANRDIEGTPPNAAPRALVIGDRLIANERVVSSPIGSGQMLFLDQTSLTVSPNSEILLDKYVYDPDTDTGELALTVTRGVMRLVGGRITKTNDAVINTPAATIGIRGGIGLLVVGENGELQVMHVAGEYTTVEANGEVLTISRSNGFAVVSPGGAPEYKGVATEAQIAGLYNQMQGGGGGSEESLGDEDAESSGISEVNSEDPDTVFEEPISTSGESAADDNSSEIEQFNLSTDVDIQQDIQASEDVNPFANFIGGAVVVGNQSFTDDFGDQIQNAAAQNFLFADDGINATFSSGSLIATFEDGTVARLPDPVDGFFAFGPEGTQSPLGQLAGFGFGDADAGLFVYYFETQNGQIGALLGAEEGPTQLRTINANNSNFRATSFNILPDLHISNNVNDMPFLPAGLGAQFSNGQQEKLFLINTPNANTFGQGSGFGTSTGARWLIPHFHVSGEGQNQKFLLHVGATSVLNNGGGSPDMTSFGRGSFRIGGQGSANRLQPFVGTTAVSAGDFGGTTVFGRSDNFIALGNSSAYHENENPDEDVSVSFFQNPASGTFETYGNFQLAERGGSQLFAPTDRFAFGASPNAYATETGRSGATQFANNEARFLSFGYSANSAVLTNQLGNDKMLFRSAYTDLTSGGAIFGRQNAQGSIVLTMDEVLDNTDVQAAQLAFGGGRSAVIDGARYGFRDHNNTGSLPGVLVDNGTLPQFIDTIGGQKTGRPDNEFGQAAFRGGLLSHGLADASSIFPGGTDLTPEYLTWGYWTGQFRFDQDPGDPTFDNARLQFALGSFVYGNRTDVLPLAGTATYDGAVLINVLAANGSDFLDGGQFQLNWDFSQGMGNANFSGLLDLGNFSVPVSLGGSPGLNDYGGNILVGGSMADVQVDGSFFDGPNANDARATAGSIRINDSLNNRFATGTYWGER